MWRAAAKGATVQAHQGNPMIHSLLTELTNATTADQAAKRDALEMGLAATRPLSLLRLQELCALGERMMDAARRKAKAEIAFAQS